MPQVQPSLFPLIPDYFPLGGEGAGPEGEGGDGGGMIVAEGTPEQVATVAESHTGTYLARMLTPENDS